MSEQFFYLYKLGQTEQLLSLQTQKGNNGTKRSCMKSKYLVFFHLES